MIVFVSDRLSSSSSNVTFHDEIIPTNTFQDLVLRSHIAGLIRYLSG